MSETSHLSPVKPTPVSGNVGWLTAGAALVAVLVVGVAVANAKPASATTLEQTCIEAGMKPMHIKAAKMHGVHKEHGNGWYGRVRGQIDAMPDECAENGYFRVLNRRVLLQNGEHRQRWSMIFPWDGSRWNGRRNGYGIVSDEAGYGVGAAFQNIAYQHNHNWTKYRYVCTPGPKRTQARYQEMHTVIHTDGTVNQYGDRISGHIEILAGPKIINRRIKVFGAC